MLSTRGYPTPKCLGDVIGIGGNRTIVIKSVDVNVVVDADHVTEVQCTSLVRSLCQTLLTLCKVTGVVEPTYMWE